MKISLQPDKLEDATMYETIKFLYQNHHSTPKELLKNELPEATYLLAFLETGRSVAPMIGFTSYKNITNTLYMTERTIICPEYRGKGYGKALSLELESYLKKLGAHKICCEVLSFNKKMLNIKLDQGYVIEGFMRNHDAPGVDQYFLSKEL